jgi:hypothetical protein
VPRLPATGGTRRVDGVVRTLETSSNCRSTVALRAAVRDATQSRVSGVAKKDECLGLGDETIVGSGPKGCGDGRCIAFAGQRLLDRIHDIGAPMTRVVVGMDDRRPEAVEKTMSGRRTVWNGGDYGSKVATAGISQSAFAASAGIANIRTAAEAIESVTVTTK